MRIELLPLQARLGQVRIDLIFHILGKMLVDTLAGNVMLYPFLGCSL